MIKKYTDENFKTSSQDKTDEKISSNTKVSSPKKEKKIKKVRINENNFNSEELH